MCQFTLNAVYLLNWLNWCSQLGDQRCLKHIHKKVNSIKLIFEWHIDCAYCAKIRTAKFEIRNCPNFDLLEVLCISRSVEKEFRTEEKKIYIIQYDTQLTLKILPSVSVIQWFRGNFSLFGIDLWFLSHGCKSAAFRCCFGTSKVSFTIPVFFFLGDYLNLMSYVNF